MSHHTIWSLKLSRVLCVCAFIYTYIIDHICHLRFDGFARLSLIWIQYIVWPTLSTSVPQNRRQSATKATTVRLETSSEKQPFNDSSLTRIKPTNVCEIEKRTKRNKKRQGNSSNGNDYNTGTQIDTNTRNMPRRRRRLRFDTVAHKHKKYYVVANSACAGGKAPFHTMKCYACKFHG